MHTGRPALGHLLAVTSGCFYEDSSVKRRHSGRHLKVTSDRSSEGLRLQS